MSYFLRFLDHLNYLEMEETTLSYLALNFDIFHLVKNYDVGF